MKYLVYALTSLFILVACGDGDSSLLEGPPKASTLPVKSLLSNQNCPEQSLESLREFNFDAVNACNTDDDCRIMTLLAEEGTAETGNVGFAVYYGAQNQDAIDGFLTTCSNMVVLTMGVQSPGQALSCSTYENTCSLIGNTF